MAKRKSSESTDARALRSRAALRQALLSLLEEQAFEDIAVRGIAARARVTFPTFYRQFATKEALLADVARDELRHLALLMGAIADRSDMATAARSICNYVRERRPLWTALLTTAAMAVMRQEFLELTFEHIERKGRINPDYPAEMTASFVVTSMLDILAWWLRQPADYPADRTARYLETLVLEPANTRHSVRNSARSRGSGRQK